jgi:hypothetical protein
VITTNRFSLKFQIEPVVPKIPLRRFALSLAYRSDDVRFGSSALQTPVAGVIAENDGFGFVRSSTKQLLGDRSFPVQDKGLNLSR